MMKRLLTVVATISAVALMNENEARAQVPGQVYDDAKHVIEELIERDVAQTVVPNIACQAPVTIVYFPTTLQHVFDRQFGTLQSAIQADAADLAGSIVYYALTATVASPRDLVPSFIAAEVSANSLGQLGGNTRCGDDIRTAGGPMHYAPNARTLLDRSCSNGSVELACDLARATKDLATGDTVAAEGETRLAIAAALNPGGTAADTQAIAALLLRYFAAVAASSAALPTTNIAEDATLPGFVSAPAFVARLQRLAREWQLATGGGKKPMTVSALLRYSLMAVDANALCAGTPECVRLRALVGAGAADLRKILEASNSRDVAGIAVDVLREVFVVRNQLECNAHPATLISASPDVKGFDLVAQKNVVAPSAAATAPVPAGPQRPDDCDRQVLISRYGQFLAALTAYSIEVGTTGNPSAETRGAFESAAFDVMQTDGPRTGMNRGFGWNILWPKPSLRLSWNSGYVNGPTGDGFRYLATIDWLTFRLPIRYTAGTYVALDFSVVDLLGPFSESALRKQVTYMNSDLEWSEFLSPRLELMFGLPTLSTHLTFVGGLSFRSAAVATNGAGALKYYSPWAGIPDDYVGGKASFYSQFIETGIGIRYLP